MTTVFLRLKLRILRNGFKGKPARVVAFVIALLFGLAFATGGFTALAFSGSMPTNVGYAVVAIVGTLLVIGWIILPVAMFGVDETLDPARFALLPLPKRTLMVGLLASAFLGVPAIAMLLATSGLVVAGFVRGGIVGGLAALVGMLLGAAVCVVGSRAVTSGFAAALRSRRSRDLALIGVTLLIALIGPMQALFSRTLTNGDPEALRNGAKIIGFSPLAAPYLAWYDIADGNVLLGLGKLAGTALVLVLLLRWWSRSIESAMVGAVSSGAQQATKKTTGGVLSLLGRAPRTAFWAIVGADLRGWWRDPRRRAALLSMVAASAAMPIAFAAGRSKLPLAIGVVWIGVFLAMAAGNQFGFGGTAYAMHLMVGVPGTLELRARALGLTLIAVPALTVIVPALGLVTGVPGQIVGGLAAAYAAFGVSLGVMAILSVRAAFALPETSNPFAVNSGGGCAKALTNLGSMLTTLVLASPVAVGAWLLGTSAWAVLLVPVGIAYGLGAVFLGTYMAGDHLDRRGPELLLAVTPGR